MVNQRSASIVKKILLVAAVILAVAIVAIVILDNIVDKEQIWKPDYTKTDISQILVKEELNQEDYFTLLEQTGLGRPAVDRLRLDYQEDSERRSTFEKYQDNFFSPATVDCKEIGWTVYEEKLVDEKGNNIKGFEIPEFKKGDVLITKSTHTIGWRHGHAAIIVDEEKGQTLESILLGFDSTIQSIEKWNTYPSFILLRLKGDEDGSKAAKIADYALEHMHGVPYGLLAGFPKKAPEQVRKTQCAHLVWYPYYMHGYDIDSDGTWLVTPKDIANSAWFEVVQVYGVNPAEIW